MCFSPEMDLAVGSALVPVGLVSLSRVREVRELPFATLPLLFAAHQLVETLVWGSPTGSHAAAVYVWFALPVLPTLVPVAVLLIEPPGRRRRVVPWVALGVLVTAHLADTVASHGVAVDENANALVYSVGLDRSVAWTCAYILAVTGACLASQHRAVVAFGGVNLLGLTAVSILYTQAFVSLWCVWAAVVSALVAWHMLEREGPRAAPWTERREQPPPRLPAVGPGGEHVR